MEVVRRCERAFVARFPGLLPREQEKQRAWFAAEKLGRALAELATSPQALTDSLHLWAEMNSEINDAAKDGAK